MNGFCPLLVPWASEVFFVPWSLSLDKTVLSWSSVMLTQRQIYVYVIYFPLDSCCLVDDSTHTGSSDELLPYLSTGLS